MITKSLLSQFSKACLELYHSDLTAETYGNFAVNFIGKLVDADMVCAATLCPHSKALSVVFSGWDDRLPEMLDGYARTMAAYKLFDFDPRVNDGLPFFRSDFYSRRQFQDVAVYKESMALMGWRDHAAVHVPTDDGKILFISLERSGTVAYSERDRKILALAQPHLINAWKMACSRSALLRGEEPFDPRLFMEAGFSERESEVLLWLTEGKSNSEMACLMDVHIQTIKFHLTSIYNKTGAGNRLAATLYALDLARLIRRRQVANLVTAYVPELPRYRGNACIVS